MPSLFTRIVQGEIPCYKVAENDSFLAFLDINPLMKGHTLCIPKMEIDYLFDLSDDLIQEMIIFSKQVALGLQTVVQCNRIGVTVIGLEVPHAHVHLIPINAIGDLSFAKEPLNFSQEEFADLARRIHQRYLSKA